MYKILFAVLLALLMTLALVGVKRIAVSSATSSQTVVAEGGAPTPPIPW